MQEILDLFTELYEKQDILSKLTQSTRLKNYGYSMIHCLDAIGALNDPNVTKISAKLKMTRGAISKITKKLLSDDLIEVYQYDYNKKEIYFKLTPKGEQLYQDHLIRHQQYELRDKRFLADQDPQRLVIVKEFLDDFNNYLSQQIMELNK